MSQTWTLERSDEEEENTLLLVHGIHPDVTKEALRNQFLRFGDVVSANVHINKRNCAMGFVQMRSVRDCAMAIAGLNGHPPLHWTVQRSAPPSERLRRRRQREEARRFEEEMRPIHEAKLKEFEQHSQRMLELTREFTASLGMQREGGQVGADQAGADQAGADPAAEPDPPEAPGDSAWPLAPGQRPCTVCTLPTAGFCQRCRTPYCSRPCQQSDWEKHQHVCGRAPSLVVSVPASPAATAQTRSVQYSPSSATSAAVSAAGGDTLESPSPLRRPRTTSGGGDAAAPPKRPAPAANKAPAQLGAVRLEAGRRYDVLVVFAPDPSTVFLRLRAQLTQVAALEDAVRRQASAAPARSLSVGQMCSARFQDCWYRAQVKAVLPDGGYRVFFLDWGNTDSVSAENVAALSPLLAAVPPQAVRASLPWRPAGADGRWSRQQLEGLASLDGRPLTASVVTGPPQYRVALFNEDGKSVLDVIGEPPPPAPAQGQGVKAPVSAAPPQQQSVKTPVLPAPPQQQSVKAPLPPPAELSSERAHAVTAVTMVHPQKVTAQLMDRPLYAAYQAAHRLLQTVAAAAPSLAEVPAAGTAVAALWKAPGEPDTAWHRAVVRASEGEGAQVALLDWGCCSTLPLQQLRPLPGTLCRAACVGLEFGLLGLSAQACPESELQFYRDRLADKEWILEVAGAEAGLTQVKLHLSSDTNPYCFNEKMAKRLQSSRQNTPAATDPVPDSSSPTSRMGNPASPARPAAQRTNPPPPLKSPGSLPVFLSQLPDPPLQVGDTHPFMIAHVERPELFYGVPLSEASTEAVEVLETLVAEVMQRQPPPAQCARPQQGQVVLARSAQSAVGWARAAVTGVTAAGPQLLLVDYGCPESAAELRQLPPELARLPTAALQLSLQGAERFSAGQRQLALKALAGDEDGAVLELTVVSLGRGGSPATVRCADISDHLLLS